MPRYFTHLASHNAPKNALHQAAANILKRHNRRLIDDADAFINAFNTEIESLNERYPRCAALRPSHYAHGSTIHIYLGAAFTINFKLLPINEET